MSSPAHTGPRGLGLTPMKRKANAQKSRKAEHKRRRVADPFTLQGRSSFKPELKALDQWLFGQAITSGTGSANHVMLLNSPMLGTDRNNRIGRKIQIKSAHVHVSLHPVTPVPTSVPENIVFMLIWDLEAGATPALSSLLTNIDTSGVASVSVLGMMNLDNAKRYKILKRINIPLRICGTATGALPCNGAAFQANQDTLDFKWNVKCNLLTQFNSGNTGVVGDITNGALVFCWWTDLGAALPTSSFDVTSRIRYYD